MVIGFNLFFFSICFSGDFDRQLNASPVLIRSRLKGQRNFFTWLGPLCHWVSLRFFWIIDSYPPTGGFHSAPPNGSKKNHGESQTWMTGASQTLTFHPEMSCRSPNKRHVFSMPHRGQDPELRRTGAVFFRRNGQWVAHLVSQVLGEQAYYCLKMKEWTFWTYPGVVVFIGSFAIYGSSFGSVMANNQTV